MKMVWKLIHRLRRVEILKEDFIEEKRVQAQQEKILVVFLSMKILANVLN